MATDHRTVTMTFFWCKFGFGKCFGASQSNHWAGHCWLLYTIHFSLPITIRSTNGLLLCRIREDDTLKMMIKKIFFFGQLMRYPLIKLFHLYNLLQMSNDYRMVHTEFFTSFSYCKRTSFDDCSQLVIISFWWLVTTFLIVKALVSFAKLLKSPLLCTFISNSWTKWIVYVLSCLSCFTTHSELK